MCESHPVMVFPALLCLYPPGNPKQWWLLRSGDAWQPFLAFRMCHLSSPAQVLRFAPCQEQFPGVVTPFSLLSHKHLQLQRS